MATYEQIKKNGKATGKWRVRYRDGKGENPQSIACPDEKTARALAGKIESHAVMHPGVSYPREGAARAVVANLDDVIVAWLRDLTRTKARRTVAIYGQSVRSYLAHVGKNSKVDAMNATTILAWDVDRVAAKVGENTRSEDIGSVLAMWTWAWKNRVDIALGVVEPVDVDRPAKVKRRTIAPTWEESQACIEMIDPGLNGRHRAIVGYYTGLRTFQITGMVYADRMHMDGAIRPPGPKTTGQITVIVDLAAGTMTVVKGKTKAETEMRRCVPLAPPLVVLMKQWHGDDPNPRVCWGNEQNAVQTITWGWQCALAAGRARPEVFGPSILTGREATTPCHAFRRGLVTGLKRAKADSEAVEYYVGHAMPGDRDRYLDPACLELVEAVARIPPLPDLGVKPSNVLPYVNAAAK